jgi:O-antigen biosynthesis protein WbqP
MKRGLDLILGGLAIVILFIPMLLVAIAVRLTSPGPILFWSMRVGKNNAIFMMPKFRTMQIDTPNVATHLLTGAQNYLTPIGGFLRRSSLDELPQLWSVLLGRMSFVGPRPALYNQNDLIAMRNAKGLQVLVPGITGWAQVNGRDELDLEQKVQLDYEYLQRRSTPFDCYILFLTGMKVLGRDGVSH